MFIYTCICVYIECIYVCIYTYTYLNVCVCVYMYIYMHVYTCVYIFVYVYADIIIFLHIYIKRNCNLDNAIGRRHGFIMNKENELQFEFSL